jgi:hypothetical protein
MGIGVIAKCAPSNAHSERRSGPTSLPLLPLPFALQTSLLSSNHSVTPHWITDQQICHRSR